MKRRLKNTVVIYYWYDRGEIRNTDDFIKLQTAFENHDFEAFKKITSKYSSDEEFTYFPGTAAVFDVDTEEIVDHINIMNPEGFSKIDDNDYEWG